MLIANSPIIWEWCISVKIPIKDNWENKLISFMFIISIATNPIIIKSPIPVIISIEVTYPFSVFCISIFCTYRNINQWIKCPILTDNPHPVVKLRSTSIEPSGPIVTCSYFGYYMGGYYMTSMKYMKYMKYMTRLVKSLDPSLPSHSSTYWRNSLLLSLSLHRIPPYFYPHK